MTPRTLTFLPAVPLSFFDCRGEAEGLSTSSSTYCHDSIPFFHTDFEKGLCYDDACVRDHDLDEKP